jgi:hypothetical protein
MSFSIWFSQGGRRTLNDSLSSTVRIAACALVLLMQGISTFAQTISPAQGSASEGATPATVATTSVEELARRLQHLEQQNSKLANQNEALTRRLEAFKGQYDELNRRLQRIEPGLGLPTPAEPASDPSAPQSPAIDGQVPGIIPLPYEAVDNGSGVLPRARSEQSDQSLPWPPVEPLLPPNSRFLVGDYDDDRGSFVLVRPTDAQRVPFELRLDLFTQARYSNFARSKDLWIDSAGERLPVQSYESVEITRNFFQFSGFGIDPRLQYTAIIFSSTAINDTVYLGWINYHFNDAFDLRVGNWLVPGTREWYESFRYTLGADRLMATTFFRPNISPGIWVQGEPIENVSYVAMLANSLNRFTQGVNRVGSSTAFGGTVKWEPQGDFGLGPSDIENHQTVSTRIGTSAAFSREANQGFGYLGQGNPEDTIIRLSDGTPLFRPGALGPGVVLKSTNVQLWTIDAAVKYRGLSLSGEYFFRWLDGFQEAGARSTIGSLFDQGALLQGSYFIVPAKLETYARSSFVTGRFGGGDEFGGGVNWYPRGTRDWRLTFEVLQINGSPAQNLLTGYRAGESGTLFQVQWFTDF